MSGTILGVPVVDGRAETPLGVVRVGPSPARFHGAFWSLRVADIDLLHRPAPTMADAIAEADRVLRALWDAARADASVDLLAALREWALWLERHGSVEHEALDPGDDGTCHVALARSHVLAADALLVEAERRGRVAGLREAAAHVAQHCSALEDEIRALLDRADAIERGEP